MIKCTICDNHQHAGIKHTCKKCKTKIVFGEMQELLIEHCPYFVQSEKSKKSMTPNTERNATERLENATKRTKEM
jgi:hypothetical protein